MSGGPTVISRGRLPRMHEVSVMTQVVESISRELEGKPITGVDTVRLEVGELTMLGKDQLEFAWGILTGKSILKGAKLIIIKKPAVVECQKCGYKGGTKHHKGIHGQIRIPGIFCPNCDGDVRIVGGRECVIRSLKARVKENGRARVGKGGKKNARR